MLPASLPEYGAGVGCDNPLTQSLNVCEHGMEYESLKKPNLLSGSAFYLGEAFGVTKPERR
jgi:hypothetical protein